MKVAYYRAKDPAQVAARKDSGPSCSLEHAPLSISAQLLRPYLDLSPFSVGPIHALGVECAYQMMAAPGSERVPSQTHMPCGLRKALTQESGLAQYAVETPQELHPALRTERWRHLLARIDQFPTLSAEEQLRVAILLDRLGFFATIIQLVPEMDNETFLKNASLASLAIIRARSQKMVHNGIEQQRRYIAILEKVACHASEHLYLNLGAAIALVVQNVKTKPGKLSQVGYWAEVAAGYYRRLQPESGGMDTLYASLYWRAVSFNPFIAGDKASTKAHLDLAERFAFAFVAGNELEEIAAKETIYPLLETRSKEAIWQKDLDLALERAQALRAYDPYDPKVFLQLGDIFLLRNQYTDALQAYRQAARLGVPCTAFSWFMIGYCLEALGDYDAACDAYLIAIKLDPRGITSVKHLIHVAERRNDLLLVNWGKGLMEQFSRNVAEIRSGAMENVLC